MRIYFLGTCAGTEPMPDRKHASVLLDVCGKLYFFDAGEGCSYTAHNMGLDILKTKNIVISHCHMDHVGGLGNLLWNIRKLTSMKNRQPDYGNIEVYIPVAETFDGVMQILKNTEGNFKTEFDVNCHIVDEGIVLKDENVCIKAYANGHLEPDKSGRSISYSYRIEAEGKVLVYSGDVGRYTDLDAAISDRADALIIETGHYGVDTALEYISGKNIGMVYFSHNGREILNFPDESEKKIKSALGENGIIAYDTFTAEL